jgi:hypothetical protein
VYVSPKRWHLPTSLHGAKTQKNIIITAVKISDLTQQSYFNWKGYTVLNEMGI